MKKILGSLAALTFLVWGSPAAAQIPQDVMPFYQSYRQALQVDDYAAADKAAYKAWKTSEEVLGDSQITGDLAANYAFLSPTEVDSKDFKKRQEAYF